MDAIGAILASAIKIDVERLKNFTTADGFNSFIDSDKIAAATILWTESSNAPARQNCAASRAVLFEVEVDRRSNFNGENI